MQKITTFLMFEQGADGAAEFYTSLFPESSIISVERYGENEMGPAGTVKRATFSLAGQQFMCLDSVVKHQFAFTPAMSLFVECETEDEIDRLAGALGEGGQELMPLGNYGFSRKFAWLNDRFGVSWQLSLC